MAASLLSDAATLALRVAFGCAMQQHAPAFLLHGPTAAPARSRALDAAVRVLTETVTRVLVDTAIGFLHIALQAAFLLVLLAVLLVLVLFAACVVAALAVIVVYLGRAQGSMSTGRRLAVLAFVLLFLVTVVVALIVVVILAIADGEE